MWKEVMNKSREPGLVKVWLWVGKEMGKGIFVALEFHISPVDLYLGID